MFIGHFVPDLVLKKMERRPRAAKTMLHSVQLLTRPDIESFLLPALMGKQAIEQFYR